MNSFWLIVAAMLVVAAAAVLLPIWFARTRSEKTFQNDINTRIFQERLTDLEHDLQQQRIDQQQYQQLRVELERTLLIDVPQGGTQEQQARSLSARWIGSVVSVVVLLLASVYYYQTSYRGEAQQWIELQQQMAATVNQALRNPEQLPEAVLEDLPNFTRVLQSKVLRDGMKDPDSLFLLGISLLQMQLADRAQALLQRAHRLAPQRTDIMMGYAQAMILNNEGRLTATSANMLHAVLQAEPDHQGALMLLGFGAFNAGNYEVALKAWQPLLDSLDPASEAAGMLRNSVARAEQLLAQPPQENATEGAESAEQTAAQTAARIDVTVELAAELTEKFTQQDTLFIFAKAASGPPMPLAAVRQPASGFPVKVVLDDSKAMMASMKLSNFQEVVVGARISKAGDVMAKPGDLEGLSQPLSLTDGPLSISLTIDQVVQ